MDKDFNNWNTVKKNIHNKKYQLFFKEREIWWCHLGVNIGYEQDGTNTYFSRPVIIVNKFNLDTCVIVPLSTTIKTGKFYFPVGSINKEEAKAILSQIRLIDKKRLINKVGTLEKTLFKKLVQKIAEVSLGLDNT